MDERAVVLRQTYRVLLLGLAVVLAAVLAAVCLVVWSIHSDAQRPSREVAHAMSTLVAAMPRDAHLVKSNSGGSDRSRVYTMRSDVATAQQELVRAFGDAGFGAERAAGSSPGEEAVTVVVPHATGVNIEPIRLRAGDGGTTVELFVTFQD